MNLIIKEIDGIKISEEELHKILDLNEILFREREPDDPVTPLEFIITGWRNPNPHRVNFKCAAYGANGDVIGYAEMGFPKESAPNYETTKHLCNEF